MSPLSSLVEARSGQSYDNKIVPQANFNPTAANIMDLCIFVSLNRFFFNVLANYF